MLVRLERLEAPDGAGRLDAALSRALDPGLRTPRLHVDAEIAEFTTRWQERSAIVHRRGSATYLRLDAEETDIAQRLDGRTTVGELALDHQADGGSIDPALVGEVVSLLERNDVLDRRPAELDVVLRQRLSPASRRMAAGLWRWLSKQTIQVPGVDRGVGAVYRVGGRLLFTPAANVACVAVVLLGLPAFAASASRGEYTLTGRVSTTAASALVVFALGALFVHELGHALSVRHAGRRIVGGGVQLYLGHPAFFIDSSDLLLAPRRARIVNALAGPYAEAVVAGTAALGVWLFPDAFLAPLLFRFAGVTYINVLVNLIPFVELDGYWLLSDLLDIPRLRQRAAAVLRHELPDRLRGRRPPLTTQERWLAAFGVAAVVVTAAALGTAWLFWGPVVTRLASALWNGGLPGRLLGLALVVLVAGPLAHSASDAGRLLVRRLRETVADLRFRLQTSWRVEAAEAIAALPSLQALLDPGELAELAGRVTRRRFREGWFVFHRGEEPGAFFVVRRGRLEVVDVHADGSERILRRLGPGDSVGALAIAERRPRTASLRARSDAELFAVDAATFQRLLAPRVAASEPIRAIGPVLSITSLPPFRALGPDGAAVLAERGRWTIAEPGQAIIEEGGPGDAFYVLASGQADVVQAGRYVRTLRAGDFFGEIALLSGGPRTATVTATTPARLFRLDADDFKELVAASFRRGLARSWAGREAMGTH